MKLAVIGLGKLGLPMACLLSKEHSVVGYDVNRSMLESLKAGSFTTYEPDCDYSNISFTDTMDEVVKQDGAIVCVNTPTAEDETMDLSQVISVCESLADVLKDRPFKVMICSTLYPETTEDIIKPILGPNIELSISPVWIAGGSVVNNLKSPPVLVLGGSSWPIDVWSPFIRIDSQNVILTDPTTAETIKLAHNAWCCAKMSFSAVLGDLPNANNLDITRFFENGGERPGKFWKYGPSYGGPCFPRDLDFWISYTDDPIATSSKSVNDIVVDDLAHVLAMYESVCILGRGYKYGVNVEQESMSIKLQDLVPNSVVVDENPGSEHDIYVIAHKELANLVPEGKAFVNLWNAASVRNFMSGNVEESNIESVSNRGS